MLKKIISGGLPGVEAAALDAAIKLDIPHEGWTYKGRKTENDDLQEKYNLKEIANPSYFERLEKNIVGSDGTVILLQPMVSLSEVLMQPRIWLTSKISHACFWN